MMSTKTLRKLLPQKVWVFLVGAYHSLNSISGFLYDARRYLLNSRNLGNRKKEMLKSSIIANYHVLEKGLAMPSRRDIFGRDVARQLISLLNEWSSRGYETELQVDAAIAVLREYSDATGFDLASLLILGNTNTLGGSREISFRETKKLARGSFPALVSARRSIRTYKEEEVDIALIERAVELATNSPSVCNRQSTMVSFTANPDLKSRILSLQNGNRGFGSHAPILLIVTGDLRSFEGGHERKQVGIDGGMFSMSLLYALTYLGLASCPLNWSVSPTTDKRLRQLGVLPKHHEVIMMMTVGEAHENFRIPVSKKNPWSQTLRSLD